MQHLSEFMNNLSKKTDRMRKLSKKDVKWEWTPDVDEDFERLKKDVTKAPCLTHFDPKRDNTSQLTRVTRDWAQRCD